MLQPLTPQEARATWGRDHAGVASHRANSAGDRVLSQGDSGAWDLFRPASLRFHDAGGPSQQQPRETALPYLVLPMNTRTVPTRRLLFLRRRMPKKLCLKEADHVVVGRRPHCHPDHEVTPLTCCGLGMEAGGPRGHLWARLGSLCHMSLPGPVTARGIPLDGISPLATKTFII